MTVLLIGAGNAWGFGLQSAPGKWGYAPPWAAGPWASGQQHAGQAFRGPDHFGSGHSGHFGDGMTDDDDSDSAGGPGFGFGNDWGLGLSDGDTFDHARWREFLLNGGMFGSGLTDWFAHKKKIWEFKKHLWMRLIEHWRAEHYHDIAPVPAPVPLLLFGSALAWLTGFVRRSRDVVEHH